jgi:hypothetical protein
MLQRASWYKKNKPGGRVYLWGGSFLHHLKTLKKPRFEDYEYVYKSEDTFAYLGNGRTELELKGTRQELAPFIRNEDTPWDIWSRVLFAVMRLGTINAL